MNLNKAKLKIGDDKMQAILYEEDNSGISELLKKIVSVYENKEIVIIDRLLIDDSFLCVYFNCSDYLNEDIPYFFDIETIILKNISKFGNTTNSSALIFKQNSREMIGKKASSGKLFLVIDSFDCFSLTYQKWVFQELVEFVKIYPQTHFLIVMKSKTLKTLSEHESKNKYKNFIHSLSIINVEKLKNSIKFTSANDAESLKNIETLLNERLLAYCRYEKINIKSLGDIYGDIYYELKDLFVSPNLKRVKVSFDINNKNDWVILAENFENFLRFCKVTFSQYRKEEDLIRSIKEPFDIIKFEKKSDKRLRLFRKCLSKNFPVNEYNGVSFSKLKEKINYSENFSESVVGYWYFNKRCNNILCIDPDDVKTSINILGENNINLKKYFNESNFMKFNISEINTIRLLLLGEQGSGKTTILKRITLAYAENDYLFIKKIGLRENMFAIYIDCTEISTDDYFLRFEDIILNALGRLYWVEINENIELRNSLKCWMLTKVKEGNLLVVIDNYEKVYKNVDFKLFEIEFNNYCRNNPKINYIIALRNEYIEDIIENHSSIFNDFDCRQIDKYDFYQISKLMKGYLKIIDSYKNNYTDTDEFIEKLLSKVNPFIKDMKIFYTPLVVVDMILNLEIPTCRYDFYEKYVNQLIDRNIGYKYSKEDIMSLLGCIAFKDLKGQTGSFRDIVKESISDLRMYLSCDIDTDQFIRFITIVLPIIGNKGVDSNSKPNIHHCPFKDYYMKVYFAVNAYKNDYLHFDEEGNISSRHRFLAEIFENSILIGECDEIISMICEKYDTSDFEPLLYFLKRGEEGIAKILLKTLLSPIYIITQQDREKIIIHTLSDDLVTESDLLSIIRYVLKNPNSRIENDISEIFNNFSEEDNLTYGKVYSVILLFNLLSEGVRPIEYICENLFNLSSVRNAIINLYVLQTYILYIKIIYNSINVFGIHAVISDSVNIKNLGLNIVDEDNKLLSDKLDYIIRRIIKWRLITEDIYIKTVGLLNMVIDAKILTFDELFWKDVFNLAITFYTKELYYKERLTDSDIWDYFPRCLVLHLDEYESNLDYITNSVYTHNKCKSEVFDLTETELLSRFIEFLNCNWWK